jgi:hypothetical protein
MYKDGWMDEWVGGSKTWINGSAVQELKKQKLLLHH